MMDCTHLTPGSCTGMLNPGLNLYPLQRGLQLGNILRGTGKPAVVMTPFTKTNCYAFQPPHIHFTSMIHCLPFPRSMSTYGKLEGHLERWDRRLGQFLSVR
jgi:hypothetical protein